MRLFVAIPLFPQFQRRVPVTCSVPEPELRLSSSKCDMASAADWAAKATFLRELCGYAWLGYLAVAGILEFVPLGSAMIHLAFFGLGPASPDVIVQLKAPRGIYVKSYA